jgi:transcriptional regulator with XRE-family HTH domain
MEQDILLKLGHKIKYERKKRKISQQNLAELSNLSVQSISTLENGINNIKFTNLYKITNALELNMGDFSEFKL